MLFSALLVLDIKQIVDNVVVICGSPSADQPLLFCLHHFIRHCLWLWHADCPKCPHTPDLLPSILTTRTYPINQFVQPKPRFYLLRKHVSGSTIVQKRVGNMVNTASCKHRNHTKFRFAYPLGQCPHRLNRLQSCRVLCSQQFLVSWISQTYFQQRLHCITLNNIWHINQHAEVSADTKTSKHWMYTDYWKQKANDL